MYKNNIGYWVKERGVKLKKISEKLGVSYQTVSNWINNRSQPDLTQAAVLADILMVSLEQLVTKEEK
ncbi:helix-turn-helix transcriptional regulator [Neobacillus sp. MM2021_6]|uniref:helix-turn-helix domain-containing protein n=1 Tax=Bacillaceae TaxID=186817 RepID=UPI00140B18F1|nr:MULTISPECIES: helix-turn-helix transcriptional regulator [Bacillaceae]MBO0959575.1 helix-turn-helix transcriptional regulator [Neobacillus sp. MM2021_6]NHC17127.1 helix-turn-helix transcriptional regulator [Bacillus sp. MM2020_4]